MANSLNKVQLIGRLGHAPEVRSTQSGQTVTTLNLATSENYGKGEDKKEKTEWHKVICWDKLGEVAGNYLKKGSQVFIEGKITYSEYEDRDKIKRYKTEIVAFSLIFLGGKNDAATASEHEEKSLAKQVEKHASQFQTNNNEDVPF